MMSHGQRARNDSERCQSDALDDAGRKADKKKSRSLQVRHKATTASRCSAERERSAREGEPKRAGDKPKTFKRAMSAVHSGAEAATLGNFVRVYKQLKQRGASNFINSST